MPIRTFRGRLVARSIAVCAALVAAVLVIPQTPVDASPPSMAALADPCGPAGNKITCENAKPGTPSSEWEISGAGDPSIQGYSTDISVNVGQRIDFKIDTDAAAYSINVYRVGYYANGEGARHIAAVTPSATLPQSQPECITDVQTDLVDCGNWSVSASWDVPATAVSGVYFAVLERSDGGASHITFVVRDDSSHSDVVFQTSDPTWQAYNTYGGANFYTGGSRGRALKLSYNRPVNTRNGPGGRDFFFSNEYPLVRFLERNGYDVSYLAGVDTDRRGQLLTNHKVFLSVGHDEYWSGGQRANVEAARDAGVNLQFLGGNDVYWRTRYEPSLDASHTSYRTLVCYKETWGKAKIDPASEWTGTWRDPRFAPRSQGADTPENSLIGTQYMSNFSDLAVTVTKAEGKLRLWRNTPLTSMSAASTALAPHTIGYESNEDVDNGRRPAGMIRLSTTVGAVPEHLQDYGNTVEPGTTEHHLTLYRAGSGALVFSAGSVQWTWGLDAKHDSPFAPVPADARMQQAQVNLFADMGVQPATLMAGLSPAAKSTDTAAPTVTIAAPAAGSTHANGTKVTVTGTASDVGGVVAGVEVSTDGGDTWHAADGKANWTYSYIQRGNGAAQVRARAMDDSANLGAAVTRSVNATCPCSVFGAITPPKPAVNDPDAVELGLKFTPSVDGFIAGVRFYKGTGNTGQHVGSLWSSSGQRLATVTFANESATGWQSATFSQSVAVTAGTQYVASYSAPAGHYAAELYGFSASTQDSGPLQVERGYGAAPAGLYGALGTFPKNTNQNVNYFVDVSFTTTDTSPLTVRQRTPLPGSSSVPIGTDISAAYSKAMVAGSQGIAVTDPTGAVVSGTTSYDPTTRRITFDPAAPLASFVTYAVKVTGADPIGGTAAAGGAWSFTTAKPASAVGVCPCTLYDDSSTPELLEADDSDAVTLGVRFATNQDGLITGVRFYKGPNNVGPHEGALWSMGGTRLAVGTFQNESTQGWQTLTFAEPVSINKDTEYIASYRTTVGRYSATLGAFSAGNLSRGPLRVTSNSGAYTYGTGVPNNSSTASYLVDPIFDRVSLPLTMTARDPAPGALDVRRGTTIRAWLSSPLASGYSVTVKSGANTIGGATALSADGTRITFTPATSLPAGAQISVVVDGLRSTDGATLPAQTWSFTTSSSADTTQSLFTTQQPAVDSVDDSAAIEVGTRFVPAEDGVIRAIRFWKGPGNNGSHTGSLWKADGTRLARVSFGNETPSGWQTATFDQPVPVLAGQAYVASYLAPQGHYAYTAGFFATDWTHQALTAPAAGGNNGVYRYGGGFPAFSFDATNYWVDVLYDANPPALKVTSRTPVDGAIDVIELVKPSITFSAALADGWSMTVAAGGLELPGIATLSADRRTLTFASATPVLALLTGTQLTVKVRGLISTEGSAAADQQWSFRTRDAGPAAQSLFPGYTPATAIVADADPIEVGTAFVPSEDGVVTHLRFHKGGAQNGGTHVGSIWSAGGQRLAKATFVDETTSGWQVQPLDMPLAVTAGTTYVVSYYAPQGHYSATPGFFAQPWTSGSLTAPATNNGRYRYGAGGGFPTGSHGSTNYGVDLRFVPSIGSASGDQAR